MQALRRPIELGGIVERANPDIAKTNGVVVILQEDCSNHRFLLLLPDRLQTTQPFRTRLTWFSTLNHAVQQGQRKSHSHCIIQPALESGA